MIEPVAASELELVAHHEAGHAVAALVTGCELWGVTIVPDRGGAGWTTFRPPPGVPRERARRDAVMRHLAGAAGEAVLVGAHSISFGEVERRCTGARADFVSARREAGTSGERAFVDVFIAHRWTRTVDLVTRRWAAVVALAKALKRDGMVDGDRAIEIMSANGGSP